MEQTFDTELIDIHVYLRGELDGIRSVKAHGETCERGGSRLT